MDFDAAGQEMQILQTQMCTEPKLAAGAGYATLVAEAGWLPHSNLIFYGLVPFCPS